MKVFLSCLILIATSTLSLASDNPQSNASVKVKTYLDKNINESKIPGIQYLVLDSNKFIFEYMGGWADIASAKPMLSNITMMSYSQTKTITAAAVLQLFAAGKLDLDDDVNLYVPNLPYKHPISIRQLLAQTSGLPDPIPLKWAHLAKEHPQFDEDSALAKVLTDNPELDFNPGKKYQYSNISYWLLGKVIEKVSGIKYEKYVREHILKPLQISQKELDYVIPDPDFHAKGYLAKYSFLNLIKGFVVDKKLTGEESVYENNWLLFNNHYLNGPAFGGLIGTAKGFGKFLQDQLRPTSVLFSNEVKTLFYTQQYTNDSKPIDMTLGWHIGSIEEKKYYFKEGGGGGFHCEMRIYPDQNIASIIMVNKTSFKSKKVLNHIDREFLKSWN